MKETAVQQSLHQHVDAARRADKLAEQVAAIEAAGGQAIAVSLDVTDEASTKAAYDAAEAAFGTIDTIVANAGVATEKVALGLSVDEVDGLFADRKSTRLNSSH